MKRFMLPIFAILMLAAPMLMAEIGVLAEIKQRRPALAQLRLDSPTLRDLNGDGVDEIFVCRSCITQVDTIDVLDGDAAAFDPIYFIDGFMNLPGGGSFSADDMRIGFLRYSGAPTPSHTMIIYPMPSAGEYCVASFDNQARTWVHTFTFTPAGAPWARVLRLPNGREALLVPTGNGIAVIGERNGFTAGTQHRFFAPTPEGNTLPLALHEKFRSKPGMRILQDIALFDSERAFDLDGDGFGDLPLLVDTGAAGPDALAVLGGGGIGVLRVYQIPEAYRADIASAGLHGFTDLDGDGKKEAVAGSNLLLMEDGTTQFIATDFRTLAVFDVDRDGVQEVFGMDMGDSSLVVYGLTGPASAADPAAPSFKLAQAYPQPAASYASLPVTLNRAARLQLDIYNVQGRRVRTLAAGDYQAGAHLFFWDGRDDEGLESVSGIYMSVLAIEGGTQTRSFIIIR